MNIQFNTFSLGNNVAIPSFSNDKFRATNPAMASTLSNDVFVKSADPVNFKGKGDGPDKDDILALLTLVGFVENPYPYIAASDIYVCSSYAEGYNTAITEALILGKPVVSTECSGVKEQLGENNEFGICTPNTEEGLYEGIKQMLNETTLKHYTKMAKERGENFTLEASMNKIYHLLES